MYTHTALLVWVCFRTCWLRSGDIVLRHDLVYAPYIDRLEREFEVARRSSPIYRAKRILETYTLEGGRKAMRSSHSRLSSNDGPTP